MSDKVLNIPLISTYKKRVKKGPPYQFSPVTSLNVRISPQNFLTFGFHSFATLLLDFKAIRSASSNLLGLNLDHPSKKLVFVIKSL